MTRVHLIRFAHFKDNQNHYPCSLGVVSRSILLSAADRYQSEPTTVLKDSGRSDGLYDVCMSNQRTDWYCLWVDQIGRQKSNHSKRLTVGRPLAVASVAPRNFVLTITPHTWVNIKIKDVVNYSRTDHYRHIFLSFYSMSKATVSSPIPPSPDRQWHLADFRLTHHVAHNSCHPRGSIQTCRSEI